MRDHRADYRMRGYMLTELSFLWNSNTEEDETDQSTLMCL